MESQTVKKPIDWVESLKKYIGSKKQRLPEEIERETDEIFLSMMEESKKR